MGRNLRAKGDREHEAGKGKREDRREHDSKMEGLARSNTSIFEPSMEYGEYLCLFCVQITYLRVKPGTARDYRRKRDVFCAGCVRVKERKLLTS